MTGDYLVESLNDFRELDTVLSEAGRKGWEIVSFSEEKWTLIFKRPIPADKQGQN